MRIHVALSDPTSLVGMLDPAKGKKMHAQYIGAHMGLLNIPSTFDGLLHYGTVTPKGQRDKDIVVLSLSFLYCLR